MKPHNVLKRIIISKTRLKLLQTFYYSLGEIFYIRQLTRMTDEKLNSVRRELQNLKEAGILESEWRGNKLFYRVNEKNPLFQEILSIVLKTKGLGRDLLKYQQRLGKVKFVLFSGKFLRRAKGKAKNEEIDLLVVGKVVLPELGALVRQEEKVKKIEINYTVMSEEDFSFRKKNRDPFLIRLLLQARVMIIGSQQELVDF